MSDNASQHEANKLLRVLNGQKLKYTVRLTEPDNKVTEFQSECGVQVKWHDASRSLWVCYEGYNGSEICQWKDGSILQVEENKS